MPSPLRPSDVRSLARLATEATVGVTRLAEGVHQSVWRTLGAPGGPEGRTRGLTGAVYRRIYGMTHRIGGHVETTLARLEPLLDGGAAPGSRPREAVLAVLNGVLGDHLVASDNPLATPMTLRYRGVALDPGALLPEATGKVLLLIHGLCMNDLQWGAAHDGQAVDHGDALASALGYTPVYLRYNSGRHISQNGRDLAALLDDVVDRWPVPVAEVAVVAHSMGGLLIRSAVHYAREGGRCWPERLRSVVFLGTPHHGAPLERGGNRVDDLLGRTRYTAPFAALGRLRSAGVTDMRYGNVLDDDWTGRDRFHRTPDPRRIVPLPDGVACYALAATTTGSRTVLASRLVGDGLVPLRSALGEHDEARRSLRFEATRIAYRMHHFDLLSHPDVSRQLVRWLAPPRAKRP